MHKVNNVKKSITILICLAPARITLSLLPRVKNELFVVKISKKAHQDGHIPNKKILDFHKMRFYFALTLFVKMLDSNQTTRVSLH